MCQAQVYTLPDVLVGRRDLKTILREGVASEPKGLMWFSGLVAHRGCHQRTRGSSGPLLCALLAYSFHSHRGALGLSLSLAGGRREEGKRAKLRQEQCQGLLSHRALGLLLGSQLD